jgi:hypothetical protein
MIFIDLSPLLGRASPKARRATEEDHASRVPEVVRLKLLKTPDVFPAPLRRPRPSLPLPAGFAGLLTAP